jgi:dolichol-phosphate mannosyltransferase
MPDTEANPGSDQSPGAALPSFCIVLPVYNEAGGIEDCVRNIAAYLKSVNTRTGIIAVDDGSSDAGCDILKRLQTSFPTLIVHRHEENDGYGAANRTGCRLAAEHGFEYALVMDAEGTQSVKFIGAFLDPMRRRVGFTQRSATLPC